MTFDEYHLIEEAIRNLGHSDRAPSNVLRHTMVMTIKTLKRVLEGYDKEVLALQQRARVEMLGECDSDLI